jgi:hypothetical protein
VKLHLFFVQPDTLLRWHRDTVRPTQDHHVGAEMSSDADDQDFVTVRCTYNMWEIESNSVGNGSERSPVASVAN